MLYALFKDTRGLDALGIFFLLFYVALTSVVLVLMTLVALLVRLTRRQGGLQPRTWLPGVTPAVAGAVLDCALEYLRSRQP